MNVYDEQHGQDREFWSGEQTRRIARPTMSPRTGSSRSTSSRSERIGHDPFVARLGILVTAGLIVIALVWAVKVSVATEGATPRVEAAATMVPVTTPPTSPAAVAPETLAPIATPAAPSATDAPVAAQAPASSQARAASSASSTTTAPTVQAASTGIAAVAVVAPVCGAKTYTILRGDAWILIARKVKVSTKELLAANGATARTALYPGRTICLPASATIPTVAPAPTAPKQAAVQQAAPAPKPTAPKPTVVQAATPAPAPATTAAPTPSVRSYSQAESVAIIREIWPDELEERALAIAWRESNHKHTARNSCCHGLFQIYFNVHKGWLKDLGITSSSHLYDPYLNARAALTLYMRAGGWGPWGG